MSGLLNNIPLLVSVFLFGLAAFLIVVMVVRIVAKDRIKVDERTQKLYDQNNAAFGQDGTPQPRKRQSGFLSSLSKLGFTQTLGEELLSASIMILPEEFLAMWAGAFIIIPGLLFLLFLNVLLALVSMAAIAILPPLYIKSKKSKKYKQFDDQLSDALMMMANSLSAGLSFQQAMENISKEMPDPIAGEFSRVLKEMRFGKTVEDALGGLLERIPSNDLMIAVNAILIQHQVGGNLSEILTTIAETIQDRHRLKKEIHVLTTQGKFSGIIISILPVFLFFVVSILNPSYMGDFLKDPIGLIMILVGIVMEFIGIILIKKIVTIEY